MDRVGVVGQERYRRRMAVHNQSVWNTIIRYLWASPATFVGLLLALLARLMRADVAVVDGVVEVVGGPYVERLLLERLRCRFVAITLGHVVIARDAHALCGCRTHERAHVRQYERWGVFLFPLYAGSSMYEWLRGRRPYWDNYFEREARSVAADAELTMRRP